MLQKGEVYLVKAERTPLRDNEAEPYDGQLVTVLRDAEEEGMGTDVLTASGASIYCYERELIEIGVISSTEVRSIQQQVARILQL